MGFSGGSLVKNPSANAGATGNAGSIPWFDPLEEEMATHSSIFAGKISWTEEPSWKQSMASQKVGTQLSDFHFHVYLKSLLTSGFYCHLKYCRTHAHEE